MDRVITDENMHWCGLPAAAAGVSTTATLGRCSADPSSVPQTAPGGPAAVLGAEIFNSATSAVT